MLENIIGTVFSWLLEDAMLMDPITFHFVAMPLKVSSWHANLHTRAPLQEALWKVYDTLSDNQITVVYVSVFLQETMRVILLYHLLKY